MHPLRTKRTIPPGPRYAELALPGRPPHHVRMPSYGTCATVIRLYAEEQKCLPRATADTSILTEERHAEIVRETVADVLTLCAEVPDETRERIAALATPAPPIRAVWSAAVDLEERANGMLIGLAWFHEAADLDTVRGADEPLLDYGARVADELEERGYTYAELSWLGNRVYNLMVAYYNAGQKLKTEAQAEGNA